MPETGWIAFVDMPAAEVYAAAKQRAITAAGIALVAMALLVQFAIALAQRIAEPVAELESAARAVHGGDFGVRATPGGPREVAAVAQEFNAMIAAQQRSDAQLRIAAIAFESQEGMMITDANAVIMRINRAFTAITGYAPEEAVGQTPRLLKSGRHDLAFYAGMWESIQRNGVWQGEIWDRRKSGEVYPKWLTITAVKSADGTVINYVSTHTDITERKLADDKIQHLAFADPLTDLPNRRLLIDRLHQALAAGARNKRRGALILIDLDNFKTLNDTLGHDTGDLLLQQVAQRLVTCVRDGDTVARLGGDEFVIMLEDLSENLEEAAKQSETVGEKILATLNRPYLLASFENRSTPSIGITLFSGQSDSIEELLKQADLAMYQAKTVGRNTLRFFDPEMQAAVTARAALEVELREALSQQQFILYYQPQVVGKGRLTGAEALVRWQHPRRGIVSPLDFVPLAEETGLILPLGQWVMETACKQLAKWATQPNTEDLTLAVNVSAHQFHQADFVEQVLAMLGSTGANPHRLKLELTESLLVSNVEGTIAKMSALKAHGIGFSMDDFGTGYSSLSYLKRLPLDQLKIDQGFVRDILIDPNDAAIAKMVIVLAESMGLTVIAEGVEIEAQRDFLAHHGCHAYQGYLFSRPVPLVEFEALARRT
ncbi:MAG: EAL domain-containing protein [Rhodocyclaceae bacterium]|nr:MAG: EAL domain-containing protein [Rhodocyclaceae bacterium]